MLANISASGLNFNIFKALCKILGQSIHSKSYSNSLDSLSALIFLWPCIWAAVICMPFFSAHSQICLVIWWQNSEWDVPNLLMHAMAVVLSQKSFTWIPWFLTIDMRLKRMDFNSRAFMLILFCINPWSYCWNSFTVCPPPMHWYISVNNICNIWVL